MSGMFRFGSAVVSIIFRLVMVASLAGYSLSTANAAMHPQMSSEALGAEVGQISAHGSDHSAKAEADHHSGEKENASQRASKDCCQDYCGVTAINCSSPELAHPRMKPTHAFVNDKRQLGLAPRLHLPPNIQ